MSKLQGQCLCGALSFTATPKSGDVGVCHCSMCRRIAAGPFFGVDCGDSLNFQKSDALGVYNSSQWAERGFCTQCGSVLFWRTKDKKMTIISINALEEAGALTLDHEVFIDEKPGYYSFAEKTQQLTGKQVMAMLAGDGETQ